MREKNGCLTIKIIKAMKNTYIMPTIKVVKVQTAKLIAQSQIGVQENAVNNVSADSRRGIADWDDED